MSKKTAIILLLACVLFAFACATNPVTGRKELMLVSEEEEKEIGRATDQQVIQQFGLYPDKDLQDYIKAIGEKIVPHTHRPELRYEFKVMDAEALNAFAVPGGYVYFTREIMAFFTSEAQLAGVIAHEIGHIAARHSAQLITRAQLAQLGLGVASILSEDFRRYTDLAGIGVQLLFLKFSRDDERQADELGVEYASKAGYDSLRLAEFFRTLDRLSPGDTGGLPGWLSTHPAPQDRVENVGKLTRLWQQKIPQDRFSINRDPYLKRIDGVILGQNPRHGFVEGDNFYHPEFRFQFPVPSGWKVINSAAQVQILPASEDASILLVLAAETSPTEAAGEFIRRSNASVLERSSTSVNGLSAAQLLTEITTEKNRLRVLSFFIRKDSRIFAFHGYADSSRFASYERAFQHTMRNFDDLRDQRILEVRPDRVRVRGAPERGTLGQVLSAMGVPHDKLEKTALLNGLELEDLVQKGMLLKIISNR
ncbi:MAG: M48 family metalloprotease [Acidobacteriota bacterium]